MNYLRSIVLAVRDSVYVTKERALHAGMTNHGRLFGVPAWVTEVSGQVYGCAKVPLFELWIGLGNWLFDFAAGFVEVNNALEAPLVVGDSVVEAEGQSKC